MGAPVQHRRVAVENLWSDAWVARCSCGREFTGGSDATVSKRCDRHVTDSNQQLEPAGETAAESRHVLVSAVKRGPHDCVSVCSCGKEFAGTTAAKAKARLDRHIVEKNQLLCPTPLKTAYGSRAEAERAMGGTWGIQHGERAAARVYRCVCGVWHLTKKPVRGGRDR